MLIYDVPMSELESIAREIGVRFEGREWHTSKGKSRVQGRILPDNTKTRGTSELAKYQRTSASQYSYSEKYERYHKVHAVCWHGFRDFFIVLFDTYPGARVNTAFADYRGRESFYGLYPGTAYRNIGSIAYPMSAADACECDHDIRDYAIDEREDRAWVAA